MREEGTPCRKPSQVGSEHAENVTIDPVISADGKLWDVQLILAGQELNSGLIPNIREPAYTSVTETVRQPEAHIERM